MPIKHLVIAGGGPLGFRFLSALIELHNNGFWSIDTLESIYGTSVGAIIGTFLLLNHDHTTLEQYLVERPWHKAIRVTAKQIIDSYYNKGLFDRKVVDTIFKPLFDAKDVSLNITLKEFYNLTKVDLHIFTFDLNKFETVELSHTLCPDWELLDCIAMSAALPGICMPILRDGKCFIDGGVMCNFPLAYCLKDHPDESEVLGIKTSLHDDVTNMPITQETSLLEYVINFTINATNYIRKSVSNPSIKNMLVCDISVNPLSVESLKGSLTSKDTRRELFNQGIEDAKTFLSDYKSA